MLPPGPPRNEKKRSGIQLTLAPGPLLFVPTPLDMPLFRVTPDRHSSSVEENAINIRIFRNQSLLPKPIKADWLQPALHEQDGPLFPPNAPPGNFQQGSGLRAAAIKTRPVYERLGRERGGVWGGEREPFFRKVPSPLPNLQFSYILPPTRLIRRRSWLVNPASLSYQMSTLSMLPPMTAVESRSTTPPWVSPL